MQTLVLKNQSDVVPHSPRHIFDVPRNILYVGPSRGLALNMAILDQIERNVKVRFGVDGRVTFFDSTGYSGPNTRIGHVTFGEKAVAVVGSMGQAGPMLRHIRFLVMDNEARDLAHLLLVQMQEQRVPLNFATALVTMGNVLMMEWADPTKYLRPQARLIG